MYLGGQCRWVPLAYLLDSRPEQKSLVTITLYRACTYVFGLSTL